MLLLTVRSLVSQMDMGFPLLADHSPNYMLCSPNEQITNEAFRVEVFQ